MGNESVIGSRIVELVTGDVIGGRDYADGYLGGHYGERSYGERVVRVARARSIQACPQRR